MQRRTLRAPGRCRPKKKAWPAGHFKKSNQGVATCIKKIMPQILKWWIAAISRANAQTGRNLECMYQRHSEDIDIKINRHLHVVGVQRQVMDTPTQGNLAVPQSHGDFAHGWSFTMSSLCCRFAKIKIKLRQVSATCQHAAGLNQDNAPLDKHVSTTGERQRNIKFLFYQNHG